MKKVLIIAMMFISLTMFSQKEKDVEKDQVKDLTEKLSKSYDSFEKAITPYVQESLSFIKETGGKAIDVASVEIPTIIKQYLIFEGIVYGFYTVLGLILFALAVFKWGPYCIKIDRWETPLSIVGYIPGVIGLIFFFKNILFFIKVTFLPKLYLVEKFITLI